MSFIAHQHFGTFKRRPVTNNNGGGGGGGGTQTQTFELYQVKESLGNLALPWVKNNTNFKPIAFLLSEGAIKKTYWDPVSQSHKPVSPPDYEPNKILNYLDSKLGDNDTNNAATNLANSNKVAYVFPDWEGEIHKNLRTTNLSDPDFLYSEKRFIEIGNLIRADRPNIIDGWYGLPWNTYYTTNTTLVNYNMPVTKFDKILAPMSWITPTFYLPFAEEEQNKGRDKTIKYFHYMAKLCIETAHRLGNKKVVPWVWHWVHPTNKNGFANMLLRPDQFADHLKILKDYRHPTIKNPDATPRGLDGVLWWDPQAEASRRHRYVSTEGKGGNQGGVAKLGTNTSSNPFGTPWIKREDLTTDADYDNMMITHYYPKVKAVMAA